VIELRPLSLADANDAVSTWHRHHKPVRGHKFSVGAFLDGALVGAVIVGRPVAQALDDGLTYEVTRMSCRGGDKNVGTRLLGAVGRACDAMGYRLGVSYTRADELGHVYRAAGWQDAGAIKGRGWDSGNKADRWLPGLYEPTTEVIDRVRWERRRA
jgi:hypothetical protein